MIYRTQEQLDEALDYWKEVLRLQDWSVKATVSRQSAMGNVDLEGCCYVYESSKCARIHLVDPTERAKDAMFAQDHEETLVHELLHIFFHPLNEMDDERIDVRIEQSINSIAEGLVRLKRVEI